MTTEDNGKNVMKKTINKRKKKISRVDAFRLKGHGFDSSSSHHVGTLGKSFTHSSLWRFGVKFRHSIRVVSGIEMNLKMRYRNNLSKWMNEEEKEGVEEVVRRRADEEEEKREKEEEDETQMEIQPRTKKWRIGNALTMRRRLLLLFILER